MGQYVLMFVGYVWQIVGTSKNFLKRKKHQMSMASDSEDSYSSSSGSHGRYMKTKKNNNDNKVQSFSPSTPPPTPASHRAAKRRKGIPHRAPMGGLIIEYQNTECFSKDYQITPIYTRLLSKCPSSPTPCLHSSLLTERDQYWRFQP